MATFGLKATRATLMHCAERSYAFQIEHSCWPRSSLTMAHCYDPLLWVGMGTPGHLRKWLDQAQTLSIEGMYSEVCQNTTLYTFLHTTLDTFLRTEHTEQCLRLLFSWLNRRPNQHGEGSRLQASRATGVFPKSCKHLRYHFKLQPG